MTTNWAGNLTYEASHLYRPSSVDELSALVAAQPRIRGLGSRHSFNRVADTPGVHVSVAGLPQDVRIDVEAGTADVPAGALYGEIVEGLDRSGWALHNLASLPHISVGGSIATGTHGSGDHNVSLAGAVAALELVTSDGTLLTVRRGEPDFDAMVVSLGCLGVVTRVTLDIEPTFQVRQDVYENLPWTSVADHLDAIMSSAYSVSIFTDWGDTGVDQIWLKTRGHQPAPDTLVGAPRATRQRHPLPEGPADVATPQLGVPGPWWDRLPHFRLGFTPSNGEELQTEYLVPRAHAVDAIGAVRSLAPLLRLHLFVSELRSIAGDDLWLSPSHDADCVAIHFTWRRHVPEVTALLPTLDDALAPYGARPHWGKVFEAGDRLGEAYPRIADFCALAERLDPDRKFANAATDAWLGR